MTEYNKSKLSVLEKIQAFILRMKTAQEYAEQALEAGIDEDFQSSEFFMGLAYDTAEDGHAQRPAEPVKTLPKFN